MQRLPDLLAEIRGSRNLVLVAEHLAQARRQAPLLQGLGHAVTLQRINQPFGPFAVALDMPITDEGVVEERLLGPLPVVGHGALRSLP